VHADIIGKKDVVFDFYVARERNLVGKDVVVTDYAVVRNVNAYHQKVARAYAGRLAFAARAMYGHELAYKVIVAYNKTRRFIPELNVLRRAAQDGVLGYTVTASYSRVAFDDGV
jgi:hypothetical protein